MRLLKVIVMFHFCGGYFGSLLGFTTLCANGTHPCEARHTIGAKKYVPNSEVMAVFVLFLFAAAILAAILNISSGISRILYK